MHIVTLGQYLRPSPKHLPVARYVTPAEFDALKDEALALGFPHVESGPLVRSSYHADGQRDIVMAIQAKLQAAPRMIPYFNGHLFDVGGVSIYMFGVLVAHRRHRRRPHRRVRRRSDAAWTRRTSAS